MVLFLSIYVPLHVVIMCFFGDRFGYYRIGSYGHMYSRIKEIPNYSNSDMMFLGSSQCYRNFDTRVFLEHGITSFNFGSSSQTPMQTKVLLTKYLDKINPKLIVFEVYPVVFQLDGIESTTDLISNDHIDYEICKLAIKTENVKVFNTLIYGFFQEYVRKNKESFQEDPEKNGDCYHSGGFVEKVEYEPYVSDSVAPPTTIDIQKDQLKAFEDCLKIIQDKSIPYLLISSPLPATTYHSISNYAEFNELMSGYGKYVDFNDILLLDDTCFFDANHLSRSGARLFDECLIQVLDTIDLKPSGE